MSYKMISIFIKNELFSCTILIGDDDRLYFEISDKEYTEMAKQIGLQIFRNRIKMLDEKITFLENNIS